MATMEGSAGEGGLSGRVGRRDGKRRREEERTMEFREGQGRLERTCPLLDGSSRRAGGGAVVREVRRGEWWSRGGREMKRGCSIEFEREEEPASERVERDR